MIQDNKLTPEFFYESVSKKTGVSVDIIRELYSLYLKRVQECLKTEKKIMIKGLGSFELSPNKILFELYQFANFLDKHPTVFIDEISKKHKRWYDEMSKLTKELLTLKRKYEYIEGSLEKLRLNHRRFDELFDNEGNCRRDFRIQDGDM